MHLLGPYSEHIVHPADRTVVPQERSVASSDPRRRTIADADALRALAWKALRDGMPRGLLRATTARASARPSSRTRGGSP